MKEFFCYHVVLFCDFGQISVMADPWHIFWGKSVIIAKATKYLDLLISSPWNILFIFLT